VAYLLLIAFFIINYAGVNVLGKMIHGLGWWKLTRHFITIVILLVTVLYPNDFTLGGRLLPESGVHSRRLLRDSGVCGHSIRHSHRRSDILVPRVQADSGVRRRGEAPRRTFFLR
jgi:hypothetical protein